MYEKAYILNLGVFSSATTMALEAEGFTYTVTNGNATITGYTGSETNLIIPSKLGSADVTAIASKAFYKNQNIISVAIQDGIEEIGNHAFYNCTKLH